MASLDAKVQKSRRKEFTGTNDVYVSLSEALFFGLRSFGAMFEGLGEIRLRDVPSRARTSGFGIAPSAKSAAGGGACDLSSQ